ncbi:hypothetical protein [Kamptonema formosum]|uniref:hypothetical protein n=1 Tax=Kamptonema formosum TaxID=331992 RepID=UPI000349BACB|nr:hypothetical protein [Oscillatoria sp. PCC 10802]
MSTNLEKTDIQTNTYFQIKEQKKLLQQAQERLYCLCIELVKIYPAEQVLQDFRNLFLHLLCRDKNEAISALYELILSNDEGEFRNTLKRCCYILINNWTTRRHPEAIQNLIELFCDPALEEETLSMSINRLRDWLKNFRNSKDYEELKLFLARYEEREQRHWSERYASYLLVPQYVNMNNSPEQREAARIQAQQLRERFKFELAMYTARLRSAYERQGEPDKNPTILGDKVLKLIEMVMAKRGQFSYKNIANIFLEQTKGILYADFKIGLQKYLIYSLENRDIVLLINTLLSKHLKNLYQSHDGKPLTDALLLRTCKRVIEVLTTEDHKSPSQLFILLVSQGHALTLVIMLLKITLLCKPVRTHLETCLAKLIEYYVDYPEEECKWVVNFLEILKITFVIYDENMRYNLIAVKNQSGKGSPTIDLDSYRIFSQQRLNLKERGGADSDRLPPAEDAGETELDELAGEPDDSADR